VCSATPDDAIKGSFQALQSKDADKLVSYCAEGFRAEIKAKMAYAFSLVDQIKISDLEIRRIVYGLLQAGLVEVVRPAGVLIPPMQVPVRPLVSQSNTEEQKSLINRIIRRIRSL